MNRTLRFALALLLLSLALAAQARQDLDHDRLRASLDALNADPVLGTLAPAERMAAEQALQQLLDKGGHGKEHAHAVYLAERRVDVAYAAAQAAAEERKLAALEREHDQLLLAASRRDAELARLEAEKQRIQSLAQAEETERLRAEAEAQRVQSEQDAESARAQAVQAKRLAEAEAKENELARKEAALLAATGSDVRERLKNLQVTHGPRGAQMTLDDIVFAPNQAGLRPEAKGGLGKLVAFVNAHPERPILIEGHTDSSGNARTNQVLSQRRADAVRALLVAAGVDAKRITVHGLGDTAPVASNDSEEGRARNRRVEVIVPER